MRISRLEIFGFKSFLERFLLNFDSHMIGIVGPNGCGKSNIVDALRWGLGETHAKQLRGNVLEDIIFNGSESKRPLGMAEVSITLRPHESLSSHSHQLPKRQELLEHPRVNGNHNDTTAQDIGAQHEVLDVDGEAAIPEGGLTRLAEAIPGLLDSVEIQVTRRLYRSGESEYFINRVPCRLRDIVDLYRAIGLGSRGLSIVQQGQIGDIISKKPVERRELLEEAAGISGFRVRVEAAQRKLDATAINISRLNDIILEVDKQVVFLRRQAKRALARNEIKQAQYQTEVDLFKAKATAIILRKENATADRSSIESELADSRNEQLSLGAAEERLRGEIEQLDVALADLRLKRDEVNRELNFRASRKHEIHLEAAEIEGKLHALEVNSRLLNERSAAVEKELNSRRLAQVDAESKLSEVEVKHELAAQSVPQSLAVVAVSSSELSAVNERLTVVRRELKEFQTELNEKQVTLASLESERKAIARQLSAISLMNVAGRTGQVAGAGHELGEGVAQVNEQHQTLLSGISVPAEYEAAVSAVLGERARYFLADDLGKAQDRYAELIKRAETTPIGFIKRHPPLRYTPLGDTQQRSSLLTNSHFQALAEVLTHPRLISLLGIESDFREALEVLIGHVFVVPSLETALDLIDSPSIPEALRGEVVMVTPKGEVASHWGFHNSNYHESLFALARSLGDKDLQLHSLSARIGQLRAVTERLEGELEGLEIARRNMEFEEQRKAHSEVTGIVAEAASLKRVVIYEQQRCEELESELHALNRQKAALVESLETLQTMRVKIHAREAELDSATVQNEEELLAQRAQVESEIISLESRKGNIRLEFAELLQKLDQVRRRVSELSEEVNSSSLSEARFDLELGMLFEECRGRYAEVVIPSRDEALALTEDPQLNLEQRINELQSEAERIRARLEREGEVDPQAIEMYEIEEKRLTDLKTQRDDLTSASATLDRTIKELKEVSRRRFLETYESVSDKFRELIPRLFGGGSGELQLIDPGDPLASGVDLVVRPPGKRLRSMELLSGGEKALVATALLLAMFLHRPSPICVLDEVDAPLDDANLDRFLTLIKEISKETQFLIITHNKQTMAAVDRLIGITMQEKGVSTALSVSFVDAERELEALVANQ